MIEVQLPKLQAASSLLVFSCLISPRTLQTRLYMECGNVIDNVSITVVPEIVCQQGL